MAAPMTARRDRRQRRARVQADVRDAALRLVGEGASFNELTVDEIARRAGITRSAFYFYFRDKHDLLVAAAADAADDLYAQADRWWHGEEPPEVRIRAGLDGVVEAFARHRDLLRVVTEVAGYDEEIRAFWRALVERFVTATAEHLERELAAGRVRPLDPARTAEALVWMAERCCYVYLATGDRAPAELAATLTDTWVAALYGFSGPPAPGDSR